VDDLDVPLGGEVHLLKRRPVLLAEAVHVDAESHWRRRFLRRCEARGSAHHWRGERQRRGSEGLHKRPSICRHVVLCCHGDTPVKRTDGLFELIVVVLLQGVRPGSLSGFLELAAF